MEHVLKDHILHRHNQLLWASFVSCRSGSGDPTGIHFPMEFRIHTILRETQHCTTTPVTCRMPSARETATTLTFKVDMLKSKLHPRLTKVSWPPSFIITLQTGQRSWLNKPKKHQASPICCKVGQKTILEERPKLASLTSSMHSPVRTRT